MNNHEQAPMDRAEADAPRVDASRRRLFRGAAGGAGVLLSVQAKTALGAGVCQSPSAMMSGNASVQPGQASCSGGRSPGYWVQPQHFGAWRQAGAIPPTFSPAIVECQDNGLGGLALQAISATGTKFSDAFGSALVVVDATYRVRGTTYTIDAWKLESLWAVIFDPNRFTNGQVARHLACAWLNSKLFAWTSAQYPITTAQVNDMWSQLIGQGYYCPAGGGCTPQSGWSKDQVKAYIEGMYDINAPVPNYCQA